MSRIARRSVLIVLSVALCAALLAVSSRAAQTPTAPALAANQPVQVAQQKILAPVARSSPAALPAQLPVPARFSANAMALEGVASAQEHLDLAILPTPEILAPTAKPRPARRPISIPGYGPQMRGRLLIQTQRIDVYIGNGTFDPQELADIAWKLESLLIQNEAGFQPTKLSRRISIGFYSKGSAPSAGTRGIAYTDVGRIEIFYNANEDMSGAFTIASHELAHQLQNERYGDAIHSRSDFLLLEGQATWVAGIRWLKEYGVPSWRGRANQLYNQGIPLNLIGAQRYGADNAYELWASFVSYIYRNYGMDALDELYISSRGRAVGSADYTGVLGKSLAELTKDWRNWVMTYEPPPSPTPEPTIAPATLTPLPAGR
jgi:hypothetical protein